MIVKVIENKNVQMLLQFTKNRDNVII